MAWRVLNDRVLVIPEDNEFVDSNPEVVRILKEGIIVAPDAYEGTVKKVAHKGTVVSWGNGCKYEWAVGEKVLYGRFSGITHTINDVKHLLLMEADIHAKEEL